MRHSSLRLLDRQSCRGLCLAGAALTAWFIASRAYRGAYAPARRMKYHPPSCARSPCSRRSLRSRCRHRHGRLGKYQTLKTTEHPLDALLSLESGSCLSFHAVASTVLSVYEGLTSVFGMGTGGAPQLNHRKGVGTSRTLITAYVRYSKLTLIKPSTY